MKSLVDALNYEIEQEEWLVKWVDQQTCEVTWESVDFMKTQFPTFHLEDKVIFRNQVYCETPNSAYLLKKG